MSPVLASEPQPLVPFAPLAAPPPDWRLPDRPRPARFKPAQPKRSATGTTRQDLPTRIRRVGERRPIYALRALGSSDLPAAIRITGVVYKKARTIKHDFFAATGFYESPSGEIVVLKVGRTGEFWGVPLLWLGRWLCNREVGFYRLLADLPQVPQLIGRVGQTGFVHAFAPGHPLERGMVVPDTFFPELAALVQELYRRDVAYVDTNKSHNILLGEDGRPHLIDFQISFAPGVLRKVPLFGWLAAMLLRRLHEADVYHIHKHWRRLRPDQLTAQQVEESRKGGWMIRLHRFFSKPYFLLRRRTFSRLKQSGRVLPEGSK